MEYFLKKKLINAELAAAAYHAANYTVCLTQTAILKTAIWQGACIAYYIPGNSGCFWGMLGEGYEILEDIIR
jgi:hypothetical protein